MKRVHQKEAASAVVGANSMANQNNKDRIKRRFVSSSGGGCGCSGSGCSASSSSCPAPTKATAQHQQQHQHVSEECNGTCCCGGSAGSPANNSGCCGGSSNPSKPPSSPSHGLLLLPIVREVAATAVAAVAAPLSPLRCCYRRVGDDANDKSAVGSGSGASPPPSLRVKLRRFVGLAGIVYLAYWSQLPAAPSSQQQLRYQQQPEPFRDFRPHLQAKAEGGGGRNGNDKSNLSIFYNVYLHSSQMHRVLDIVAEQLDQVKESSTCSSIGGPDGSCVLYYNTIGRNLVFVRKYAVWRIQRFCTVRGLRCVHMNHYDNAFEEVTLQSLYDYCHQVEDAPGPDSAGGDGRNAYTYADAKVVYLHNKGSYNPAGVEQNGYWRRYLTHAALRDECVNPPPLIEGNGTAASSVGTCNVCGLDFWPIWSPFFPGNMWTARCSYVAKLLPPVGLERRFQQLYDKVREYQEAKKFNEGYLGLDSNMWPPIADRFGLERYSSEHWIGSHPALMPCDMSNMRADHNLWAEHGDERSIEKDMQWSVAPRYPLYWAPEDVADNDDNRDKDSNYWHVLVHPPFRETKLQFLKLKENRLRDCYLLPGLLHKWIFLYSEVPSVTSSWIWKWFPDGEYWKAQVKEHGLKVIEEEL